MDGKTDVTQLGPLLFRLEQQETHWRAQNQPWVAAKLRAQIDWYRKNPGQVKDTALAMQDVTKAVFMGNHTTHPGPFFATKRMARQSARLSCRGGE